MSHHFIRWPNNPQIAEEPGFEPAIHGAIADALASTLNPLPIGFAYLAKKCLGQGRLNP